MDEERRLLLAEVASEKTRKLKKRKINWGAGLLKLQSKTAEQSASKLSAETTSSERRGSDHGSRTRSVEVSNVDDTYGEERPPVADLPNNAKPSSTLELPPKTDTKISTRPDAVKSVTARRNSPSPPKKAAVVSTKPTDSSIALVNMRGSGRRSRSPVPNRRSRSPRRRSRSRSPARSHRRPAESHRSRHSRSRERGRRRSKSRSRSPRR